MEGLLIECDPSFRIEKISFPPYLLSRSMVTLVATWWTRLLTLPIGSLLVGRLERPTSRLHIRALSRGTCLGLRSGARWAVVLSKSD